MIASAHDFSYEFAWIRNGRTIDEMIEGISDLTNNTQNSLSPPEY